MDFNVIYDSHLINWLQSILDDRFGQHFRLTFKGGDQKEGMILSLPGSPGTLTFSPLSSDFFQPNAAISCFEWNASKEGYESILNSPIPAPSSSSGLPFPLIEQSEEGYFIHYDILGLIFWMLGRMEETNVTDLDNHERFPAKSSHAIKHNYLDRPIVDEWMYILAQVIQRQWPSIRLKLDEPKTIISCDVDNPYESYIGNRYRFLRRLGSELFKRRNPAGFINAAQNYFLTSKGNYSVDPNNTFDWIMDVNEKVGNQVAFYFLVDQSVPAFDAYYSINEPRIRKLMRRIHDRGHEIGLHGSYGTYKNGVQLKKEVSILRQVMDKEGIDQPEIGARQHYLRWSTPETARLLDEAGITYDTTLSYADHAGFRCGTCHEYPMFDLKMHQPLKIKQRPLILMETSVIDAHYMGLGYSESALELMMGYKRTCHQFGGDFTLLWHNSHLRTEADKRFYRELIA